jgi:hypothetical protein
MLAWLLIITIGGGTLTVPGIATQSECLKLADRFRTSLDAPPPLARCVDYRTVAP